jgi:hypothetical protein
MDIYVFKADINAGGVKILLLWACKNGYALAFLGQPVIASCNFLSGNLYVLSLIGV